MAKPTERALKRKPKAVILLTTLRKDVPNVPDGQGGREFEWFDTDTGMREHFDKNVEYHTADAKEHDDMAYLAVEITDTKDMSLGRVDVQPATDETTAWLESIKDDITTAFVPVKEATSAESDGSKKVVRPRRKSAAAAAVVKDDSKTKAARLKERLAAKQPEKKSETGDKPPVAAKPKAPAKKAEEPAKEPEFVVKKAATASA